MRSWTPLEGPFHGFLITHGEAISIADILTLRDGEAVIPADGPLRLSSVRRAVLSIHELAGKNWHIQPEEAPHDGRDHTGGIDELGVLLIAGHPRLLLVRLEAEHARGDAGLAPHNNATSLQVTAAVFGGGSGRSRIRRAASSSPKTWISAATSRSACPTWAKSSANTPTGTRCTTVQGSHPRTSTPRIPGSSRTSKSSDCVISYPVPFVHPPPSAFR